MRLLVAIAFTLMGVFRFAILFIPFRHLARTMGRRNGNTPVSVERHTLMKAAKIGWAIERTSRFTPWESKCLVKALAGQTLLRVLRVPTTLYLGVSKDESNKMIAHAWLRCGELILTGANEASMFRPVAQFASLAGKEA
nr:lasso peptide biosynthesis B2 protein [Paenibacillus methanolicus]